MIRPKTCHSCALVTSRCTWVQMTRQVSGYTRVVALKTDTGRSGVVPCTQGKVCKLGQGLTRLLGLAELRMHDESRQKNGGRSCESMALWMARPLEVVLASAYLPHPPVLTTRHASFGTTTLTSPPERRDIPRLDQHLEDCCRS